MTGTWAIWTLIGSAGGTMLAFAFVLWARYGESLFVDTLLSGIAGCFG